MIAALESRTFMPSFFFLITHFSRLLDVVSCSIAPATRLQPIAKSASGKAQADKQAHQHPLPSAETGIMPGKNGYFSLFPQKIKIELKLH